MTRFAIRCDTEGGTVLSSEIEVDAWDAIEQLISFLNKENAKGMFNWKSRDRRTEAREVYAWRSSIDLIKDSDLSVVDISGVVSPLTRSKPIMLRMAGEITNALLHSYNLGHRITFFQCDEKEPS